MGIIGKTNQKISIFQNVNTSKCKIGNIRVQQHNQNHIEQYTLSFFFKKRTPKLRFNESRFSEILRLVNKSQLP